MKTFRSTIFELASGLLISCAAASIHAATLTIDCHDFGMKHSGTKEVVNIDFMLNASPQIPGGVLKDRVFLNYDTSRVYQQLYLPDQNKVNTKDGSDIACSMPFNPQNMQPILKFGTPDTHHADKNRPRSVKIYLPEHGSPGGGNHEFYSRREWPLGLKSGEANAMWIDRLIYADHGLDFFVEFGRDGSRGYCLSSDPNDSFGSDRQGRPCSPCWDFDLLTGKATTCDPKFPLKPLGYRQYPTQ